MLGLMSGSQVERAVEYVLQAARDAAAAKTAEAGSSSAFAQLLPHAGRLVVHLSEALPDSVGEAPPLAAEEEAARKHHMGCELLFGLIHAGGKAADAHKVLRPLLLETMMLVQQQPPHRLELLTHRLLSIVLVAIANAATAATAAGARDEPTDAENCGVTVLDLPPLIAELAEVLTLRSAGCAAALLPSLTQVCRQAMADADAARLRAGVTYLLACSGLRRAELPGRLGLRRSLETIVADIKAVGASPGGESSLLTENTASAEFERLSAPINKLVGLLKG